VELQLVAHHALQLRDLVLQGREVYRPLEDDPELLEVDRLLVVIICAQRDGLDGSGFFRVAGDHDDLGADLPGHDLVEEPEPLLGSVRGGGEPEVKQDHRRILGIEEVKGLCSVRSERDLVRIA